MSFRNRLEDSKDAVYIFIAIAVGFACGVQAVDIALRRVGHLQRAGAGALVDRLRPGAGRGPGWAGGAAAQAGHGAGQPHPAVRVAGRPGDPASPSARTSWRRWPTGSRRGRAHS